MELRDEHVVVLGEVGALIARHGAILSDFEIDTISEIASRFARHKREAEITSREWAVVEDVAGALRKAAEGAGARA